MKKFVRASPTSEAIKRRKLKRLKETAFGIFAIAALLWGMAAVGQSDFETYQMECQAGLRSCGQ